LDFVTATSNLRSIIFDIEVKSQFIVKGIQNKLFLYKLMPKILLTIK